MTTRTAPTPVPVSGVRLRVGNTRSASAALRNPPRGSSPRSNHSSHRRSSPRVSLHASIRGLSPSQDFNFVFFNDEGKEQWFSEEMVPATEQNVLKASGRWLRPNGGTEPQTALMKAIAQRPDIIFIMSDGVIPEETVALASLTPRGTVIHTICFQMDRGERLLRAIAHAGGGHYRFVD